MLFTLKKFYSAFDILTSTVNVLKFRTPKTKEHPKFIFHPHHHETKGSKKFCKGRQFNCLTLQFGYFPHRFFVILLFEIKILLYKFLEHLSYILVVLLDVIQIQSPEDTGIDRVKSGKMCLWGQFSLQSSVLSTLVRLNGDIDSFNLCIVLCHKEMRQFSLERYDRH